MDEEDGGGGGEGESRFEVGVMRGWVKHMEKRCESAGELGKLTRGLAMVAAHLTQWNSETTRPLLSLRTNTESCIARRHTGFKLHEVVASPPSRHAFLAVSRLYATSCSGEPEHRRY